MRDNVSSRDQEHRPKWCISLVSIGVPLAKRRKQARRSETSAWLARAGRREQISLPWLASWYWQRRQTLARALSGHFIPHVVIGSLSLRRNAIDLGGIFWWLILGVRKNNNLRGRRKQKPNAETTPHPSWELTHRHTPCRCFSRMTHHRKLCKPRKAVSRRLDLGIPPCLCSFPADRVPWGGKMAQR